MDSPRRPPLRSEVRNPEITDMTLLSRVDSPFTDMESNYGGCGTDGGSTDGVWSGPPIERCMSCISKLGAMSRSSTATITPGGGGVPPCWELHTCDGHSISSGSDSSGWSQAVTRPPSRPPRGVTTNDSPTRNNKHYDNYDIPNFPYPVLHEHNKTDTLNIEHTYDTPRKIKECLAGGDMSSATVRKMCGCILKINNRQPVESERPCYCQRLLSCWGQPDSKPDVNALYAQVDLSKKCSRNNPNNSNYANLVPLIPSKNRTNSNNYENMDFAESLKLYENAKQMAQKTQNPSTCTKCGHHTTQDDYLMMEPQKPPPGYLPMSPAVKQRLSKIMSNSNPNLTKPSGSAMMQGNSAIYQRKQLLDCTDNVIINRQRSNSADSSSRTEQETPEENPVCTCQAVRRSSSVPSKSNRDSSSSNDSGVFELPRNRVLVPQTLPRRSKSSDPLKDISFNFQKNNEQSNKSASAEAEVPVCPSGSTSSGTSDMSDYFETLSLSSSHSSSTADVPQPPSCTLRPRSGNEYLIHQRLIAPVPEERIN